MMPATIHMKNGDWFKVDAYRDDIAASLQALDTGTTPYVTYERLDAGIPLPKVTIDLREVAYVNEVRR